MENQKPEAMFPILFAPQGTIPWKRAWVHNIATVTPLDPAPAYTTGATEFSDGVEHFPFLHTFLATMFSDGRDLEEDESLQTLLAWTKHFYVNAVNQAPKPGQALVLAGNPGTGKSLFANRILGELMGGAADASAMFIPAGRPPVDALVETPVWLVDDCAMPENPRGQRYITRSIMKFVMDPEIAFRRKWQHEMSIPFNGRVVIACNLDEAALRSIPELDSSSIERFIMLKLAGEGRHLGGRIALDAAITRELPNFARFLLDWEPSSRWVARDRRYGVRAYQHPDLVKSQSDEPST